FELGNNAAQHMLIQVKIIRIELDHVLAAVLGIKRFIPAAADAQILPFRNEMNELRVAHTAKHSRGLVCGMVIYNDQVKIETGLLAERTLHSFQDRSLAVSHRNHNARSNWKSIVGAVCDRGSPRGSVHGLESGRKPG